MPLHSAILWIFWEFANFWLKWTVIFPENEERKIEKLCFWKLNFASWNVLLNSELWMWWNLISGLVFSQDSAFNFQYSFPLARGKSNNHIPLPSSSCPIVWITILYSEWSKGVPTGKVILRFSMFEHLWTQREGKLEWTTSCARNTRRAECVRADDEISYSKESSKIFELLNL